MFVSVCIECITLLPPHLGRAPLGLGAQRGSRWIAVTLDCKSYNVSLIAYATDRQKLLGPHTVHTPVRHAEAYSTGRCGGASLAATLTPRLCGKWTRAHCGIFQIETWRQESKRRITE